MKGAEDQGDGSQRAGSSDSAGVSRSDEVYTSARPRSSTLGGTTLPFARSQVQKADYEITRAWLANRAWLISLSHGLLSIDDAEEPLRVDHALSLARSTLEICNSLSLASMEAHGVGFALKLVRALVWRSGRASTDSSLFSTTWRARWCCSARTRQLRAPSAKARPHAPRAAHTAAALPTRRTMHLRRRCGRRVRRRCSATQRRSCRTLWCWCVVACS